MDFAGSTSYEIHTLVILYNNLLDTLASTYILHRTTYRLWYTGISELLSSSKSKKTEDLADQTTACLDNFPGFLMSLLLSRSFQKGTHET